MPLKINEKKYFDDRNQPVTLTGQLATTGPVLCEWSPYRVGPCRHFDTSAGVYTNYYGMRCVNCAIRGPGAYAHATCTGPRIVRVDEVTDAKDTGRSSARAA